jgi:hypothetical protein
MRPTPLTRAVDASVDGLDLDKLGFVASQRLLIKNQTAFV